MATVNSINLQRKGRHWPEIVYGEKDRGGDCQEQARPGFIIKGKDREHKRTRPHPFESEALLQSTDNGIFSRIANKKTEINRNDDSGMDIVEEE